jgi:ATP synthase protein I
MLPGMSAYRRWYRRFFGLESSETQQEEETAPSKSSSSPGRAAAGAGVEVAGGILLFAGLGYLVDRWLGTWPWGMITGCLLGLAGGMYLVIQTARRL